jgi:hypothetical protein
MQFGKIQGIAFMVLGLNSSKNSSYAGRTHDPGRCSRRSNDKNSGEQDEFGTGDRRGHFAPWGTGNLRHGAAHRRTSLEGCRQVNKGRKNLRSARLGLVLQSCVNLQVVNHPL